MSNVEDWNPSANANNDPSPDGFPEGMPPSGVNDSAREVMAAVRRFYDQLTDPLNPTPITVVNATNAANADDAGLLEGQNSAYHLSRANHTGTQTPATISPQPNDGGLNASTLQGFTVQDIIDASPQFVVVGDELGKTEWTGVYKQLAEDVNYTGVFFKPDGTKVFFVGTTNRVVYEYSLSTPFDMSTISYTGVSFSVAAEFTSPQGLIFRNDGGPDDGKRMYMIQAATGAQKIVQYNLSTAWDISTALVAGSWNLTGVTNGDGQSLDISADGSKFYTHGIVAGLCRQFNLSTNWDITTAVNAGSFDIDESVTGFPAGLNFNSDGTVLYVVWRGGGTNNRIHAYNLTFPYDITAGVTLALDFPRASITLANLFWSDIAFDPDRRKFFCCSISNNYVFEFDCFRINPFV